jgi:hypothetical protein
MDWTGRYDAVLIASFLLCLICGAAAFVIKRPAQRAAVAPAIS